jgi:uncharacterized membrane protein
MRAMKPTESRYPRARIDTLFDGIFAVSMTLLVLDIRLPPDFEPSGNAQLLSGLLALWPKLMPYLLSFYVLGARWLQSVQIRTSVEFYSQAYIRWWLLYLLLITCVPFTTIVVGRYASLAPAVWLYAGNTALIALVSWRLLSLTPELESVSHRRARTIALAVLLASALLCIGWSFWNPEYSLFGLLLNGATPAIKRRLVKSSGE